PALSSPVPHACSSAVRALAWRAHSVGPVTPARPQGAGVLGGYFAERIMPAVLDAVRAVADALESSGVRVVGVDGHGIDDAPSVWNDVAYAEFARAHGHLLEHPELLGEPTRAALEHGLGVSAERRAQ